MWNKIFALFKGPIKQVTVLPPPEPQTNRLKALLATQSLGGYVEHHRFSHSKAARTSFDNIYLNIIDACESMQAISALVYSSKVLSPTTLVFQKRQHTVSEFLTQEGYYLNTQTIKVYHKQASDFLELLENTDKAVYGRDEYYRRSLNHVFIAIKDISHSVCSCYEAKS